MFADVPTAPCCTRVSEHDLDSRKGFFLGYFVLMENATNPI